MPLRKKHVRRIVFAALVVGVVGPVLGLVLYGLHLRGGAYSVALKAELESCLRCQADVAGARPTGPATAAADSVRLVWTVGASGRLTLRLAGLAARSNTFGWYITAAEGELLLEGDSPADVLAALNQRLVQAEHPSRLVALTVERLGVDAALPPMRIQTDVRALALSNMTTYAVAFYDAREAEGPRDAPTRETDLRPLAALRLNPTSDKGVFEGLHLEMKGVPLATLRRALGDKAGAEARGTADLDVRWRWPETGADAAIVTASARKMELAEWTKTLPGGPITGTADLDVRFEQRGTGPPALEVRLDGAGGTLAGETLDWLGGLPAGLRRLGAASPKTVPFDRMTVHLLAVGDAARLDGPRDAAGTIPVLVARVAGADVPLLRAWPGPLPARRLWASLQPALGLGRAAPGAEARK